MLGAINREQKGVVACMQQPLLIFIVFYFFAQFSRYILSRKWAFSFLFE